MLTAIPEPFSGAGYCRDTGNDGNEASMTAWQDGSALPGDVCQDGYQDG
jgi:hypothetical protein